MAKLSRRQLAAAELERRRRHRLALDGPAPLIRAETTFIDWVEELAAAGLRVDGIPFTLDDRPAMRWIYSLLPSTPAEAYQQVLILQKCAQVGFTVLEMLFAIYAALKWAPCKVGMYLPGRDLAAGKSAERFVPIVRTIPEAYRLLTRGGSSEGNVMIRSMGESRFHFLWTSGKATTESFPMDVITFDEVQEMTIADMEKTRERLSASKVRYTLMGSTANWPDADINWWFKQGTQHRFHTECPSCGEDFIFDDHFPQCVSFVEAVNDYRYVCPFCQGVIEDPQRGEWRAHNPLADPRMISVHFTQFLSPTISPREMIEAYRNASDMKNFFNRKLGKPYTDPSQMPVSLDVLNECARLGKEAGLVWKPGAKQTFMGIDNMGGFSCVIIVERLADGRMAFVHAEAVYALDPWARLDELMDQYGVAVCVSEQLPNYDSAKQFANRHKGRVFLVAAYKNIDDDMIQWGDATVSKADRKTAAEYRDRYTLSADQYKLMSWSLARLVKGTTIFPDPAGLVQEVEEKGEKMLVPLLRDVIFKHFTHTALVTEKDDEEHKVRRKVVKVGIDPHFSFAYMLACAAWCRAYGTTQFILPTSPGDEPAGERRAAVEAAMPGLPQGVLAALDDLPSGEVCGRCTAFQAETSTCSERNVLVRPQDPGCPWFLPNS